MGSGFFLSRRGLKALKSERLFFDSDRIGLKESFDLLFKYLDMQLTELTSRQCEVLFPMLNSNDGLSINDLATTLNIATASKSLKASGWQLISELNWRFINHIKLVK